MKTLTDYLLIAASVAIFVADVMAPPGYGFPFIYAALLWFMPAARKLKPHAFRIGVLFAALTISAGAARPQSEAGITLFNRIIALFYIGGAAHMVRDQIHGRERLENLERRIGR